MTPRLLALLLLPVFLPVFVSTAAAADRPNLLLITADDLGLQLGCYGDQAVPTPHLDALAASSLRFRTAYVTQASCSSSRSSLLTGLYPHTNGQYGLGNRPEPFELTAEAQRQTLPGVLKAQGYRAGILGKLHVRPFDAFDWDTFDKTGFGSRDVRTQVDLAGQFVDSAGDAPWMLMVNLFDPHGAKRKRKDGTLGEWYFPNVVDGLPTDPIGPKDTRPWPWQGVADEAQRKRIAGFYNCVARIDAAIGLLLDRLDLQAGSDAAAHTVVMFVGDHGPPFFRGKTTCYESGLRIPYLVRWPGVLDAGTSDRLVSTVDLYATMLDAAGVDTEGITRHGRSLRTVAGGDWRSTLVAEHHWHGPGRYCPRRAIRDDRFKLIHNLKPQNGAYDSVDGDTLYKRLPKIADVPPRVRAALDRAVRPPEWELYDLAADPVEFVNLADDPGHADTMRRLQDELAEWQQRTDDPLIDGPQPLEGADR